MALLITRCRNAGFHCHLFGLRFHCVPSRNTFLIQCIPDSRCPLKTTTRTTTPCSGVGDPPDAHEQTPPRAVPVSVWNVRPPVSWREDGWIYWTTGAADLGQVVRHRDFRRPWFEFARHPRFHVAGGRCLFLYPMPRSEVFERLCCVDAALAPRVVSDRHAQTTIRRSVTTGQRPLWTRWHSSTRRPVSGRTGDG